MRIVKPIAVAVLALLVFSCVDRHGLEAEVGPKGPATAAQLEESAAVIRTRMKQRRIRGGKVWVQDGRIFVRIPGSQAGAEQAAAILRPTPALHMWALDDAECTRLTEAKGAPEGGEVVREREGAFVRAGERQVLEAWGKDVQTSATFRVARNAARRGQPAVWQGYCVVETWDPAGHIVDAQPAEGPAGTEVALRLDEPGAAAFADLTEKYAGSRLAILLDEDMVSAPLIRERIAGGNIRVTLGGSPHPEAQEAEAVQLAQALQAGAFPVPLQILTQRMY